jgi:hypothetical protein
MQPEPGATFVTPFAACEGAPALLSCPSPPSRWELASTPRLPLWRTASLCGPLPYADSSRVAIINLLFAEGGDLGFSGNALRDWLPRLRTVETAAGYYRREVTVRVALTPGPVNRGRRTGADRRLHYVDERLPSRQSPDSGELSRGAREGASQEQTRNRTPDRDHAAATRRCLAGSQAPWFEAGSQRGTGYVDRHRRGRAPDRRRRRPSSRPCTAAPGGCRHQPARA